MIPTKNRARRSMETTPTATTRRNIDRERPPVRVPPSSDGVPKFASAAGGEVAEGSPEAIAEPLSLTR
jgi:hypothetical protein